MVPLRCSRDGARGQHGAGQNHFWALPFVMPYSGAAPTVLTVGGQRLLWGQACAPHRLRPQTAPTSLLPPDTASRFCHHLQTSHTHRQRKAAPPSSPPLCPALPSPRFIKKSNEGRGAAGLSELRQAYEFSVDTVGQDMDAGGLWRVSIGRRGVWGVWAQGRLVTNPTPCHPAPHLVGMRHVAQVGLLWMG